MHPNWRALSTINLKIKPFVTEERLDSVKQHSKNISPTILKKQTDGSRGEDIKHFYDNIIKETFNKSKINREPLFHKFEVTKSKDELKKVEFNKNKFFRAAVENDFETLKIFNYENNDINSTDSFGWTALMMAVCEGAADAIKCLLELGADPKIGDSKGNNSFSLAEKRNFFNVLEMLSDHENNVKYANSIFQEVSDKDKLCKFESFFCEICSKEFYETTIKCHETSTLHQFNAGRNINKKPLYRFAIASKNPGYQLMVKQGWDKQSGLGPKNSGRLFPVKTVIRKNRSGLGTKQDTAKVTHFGPFDYRAVKYNPPPRSKTRKEIERDLRRNRRIERRLRNEIS